jgi:hypothetical protein
VVVVGGSVVDVVVVVDVVEVEVVDDVAVVVLAMLRGLLLQAVITRIAAMIVTGRCTRPACRLRGPITSRVAR